MQTFCCGKESLRCMEWASHRMPLRKVKRHYPFRILCTAMFSGGKRFLNGDELGCVSMWHLEREKPEWIVPNDTGEFAIYLRICKNEELIVVNYNMGMVKVLDLQGNCLHTLQCYINSPVVVSNNTDYLFFVETQQEFISKIHVPTFELSEHKLYFDQDLEVFSLGTSGKWILAVMRYRIHGHQCGLLILDSNTLCEHQALIGNYYLVEARGCSNSSSIVTLATSQSIEVVRIDPETGEPSLLNQIVYDSNSTFFFFTLPSRNVLINYNDDSSEDCQVLELDPIDGSVLRKLNLLQNSEDTIKPFDMTCNGSELIVFDSENNAQVFSMLPK